MHVAGKHASHKFSQIGNKYHKVSIFLTDAGIGKLFSDKSKFLRKFKNFFLHIFKPNQMSYKEILR